MNKFHYVSIFLLVAVVMTISTQAASAQIASFEPMQVTPTPTPTPSNTVPNTQLNLETLFQTLLTQEQSSVDSVVLATELERILDDLAGGQYQISAEFEDNGEDTETEKTLTVKVVPVGVTPTPIEEEPIAEEPEEDNGGDDDGGDDDGGDDDGVDDDGGDD